MSEELFAAAKAKNAELCAGLEPPLFWELFQQIALIPRPSKYEEGMGRYLLEFGRSRGLETKNDEISARDDLADPVGNVLITVPASSPELESKKVITFQGHQDMVPCKDDDREHDFRTEPILWAKEEEGFLTAHKTTLGADNGAGVAMMLLLIDQHKTYKHGKLEFLFTMDEETDMTGAEGVAEDFFIGDYIINLDSEDWGDIFVGCAGGGSATARMAVSGDKVEACPAGMTSLTHIDLDHFLGGHSGCDIHRERANPIKVAAIILRRIIEAGVDFRVADVDGGDKPYNAIPRRCQLIIACAPDSTEAVREIAGKVVAETRVEYGSVDGEITAEIGPSAGLRVPLPGTPAAEREGFADGNVLTADVTDRWVKLVHLLPHGVIRHSHDLEGGIPESSANLAFVHFSETRDELTMGTLVRSFIYDKIDELRALVKIPTELCGCVCEYGSKYPGWLPDMSSGLLAVCRESYEELTGGEKPRIMAIHAGLECGVLMTKRSVPVEAISFGPTIYNAHTSNEKLQVATVPLCVEYVYKVIAKVAEAED